MTRGVRCCVAALLATLLLAAGLAAQDAAPEAASASEKEQIDAALKLTKEAAGKYEFTLGETDERRVELLAEPLLKWSNPAQGEIHGNVFLWTSGGRPAVVGSIFKWFSPHTHMSHEFHSLWEQPLRGKLDGQDVWVTEPGLTFAPLDGAPPPAAGKGQRLLQMRELARACAATKRERNGNVSELRLLTQPIFRYAAPQAGIIDGALFAFVQGTDPEVFLLLEDRETSGKPQWQLAATRMNSVEFDLRYRDKSIWKAEIMPWADISGHRLPYTSFRHEMP